MSRITWRGGAIFDGQSLHEGHALLALAGRITAIVPEAEAPPGGRVVELAGDILCPGYVDL